MKYYGVVTGTKGWCHIQASGIIVVNCGKTGRENGAMEYSNAGVRRGTCDTIKLEKGETSRSVRSYAVVTSEDIP